MGGWENLSAVLEVYIKNKIVSKIEEKNKKVQRKGIKQGYRSKPIS